jgi:microcystin-dependent protein
VSLIQSEIPAHNHGLNAANNFGTGADPTDGVFSRGRYGTGSGGSVAMYIAAAPDAAMDPRALAVAGGSQPHNNMQPYLGFNFCIALQGIYPPRQ